MTDQAFQTQYRQEYVAAFEQGQSFYRAAGVPAIDESVIKGNTAVFLVAGTGGAEATTRGTNGLIPTRQDDLNQYSCTLQEWHDKVRKTNFNIFASQGNGRQIMQAGSVKVLNRKIDDQMRDALVAGTQTTGAATTATLAMFAKAQAILGNADVDIEEEDKIFCAISPAARNYLLQVPEFTKADYVDIKPLVGPAVRMRRWMGMNFFVSNRLTGRTTNAEKMLLWHRDAIGWAADVAGMEVLADYNKEEGYYWSRAQLNFGVKLLQNTGVVVINHDGSGIVAS